MGNVALQKKHIKERVLQKRDALPEDKRKYLSEAIIENLEKIPEFHRARTFAIFVTFRSEVETRSLIEKLVCDGAIVAVPKVLGDGIMQFYKITNLENDLSPGAYGILEPKTGLPKLKPEDFDMMIAPGSVFDDRGYRIGYGGGFYDRYIPQLRPGCKVISLAFDLQIVDMVPAESFDKKVDMIVTEKRIILGT